jgi:hypothetical protein
MYPLWFRATLFTVCSALVLFPLGIYSFSVPTLSGIATRSRGSAGDHRQGDYKLYSASTITMTEEFTEKDYTLIFCRRVVDNGPDVPPTKEILLGMKKRG